MRSSTVERRTHTRAVLVGLATLADPWTGGHRLICSQTRSCRTPTELRHVLRAMTIGQIGGAGCGLALLGAGAFLVIAQHQDVLGGATALLPLVTIQTLYYGLMRRL
jgi:hypothetical protein